LSWRKKGKSAEGKCHAFAFSISFARGGGKRIEKRGKDWRGFAASPRKGRKGV